MSFSSKIDPGSRLIVTVLLTALRCGAVMFGTVSTAAAHGEEGREEVGSASRGGAAAALPLEEDADVRLEILPGSPPSWCMRYEAGGVLRRPLNDKALATCLDRCIEREIASRTTHCLLAKNQISTLPATIGAFTGLNTLDLSGNGLREVPAVIAQLTQMRDLNLSGNQISTLPEEIGGLTHLRNLDLSNNHLTDLPSFTRLRALTRCRLTRNALTRWPEGLEHCTALEYLEVGHNRLSALPRLHCPRLNGINLTENPCVQGTPTTPLLPTQCIVPPHTENAHLDICLGVRPVACFLLPGSRPYTTRIHLYDRTVMPREEPLPWVLSEACAALGWRKHPETLVIPKGVESVICTLNARAEPPRIEGRVLEGLKGRALMTALKSGLVTRVYTCEPTHVPEGQIVHKLYGCWICVPETRVRVASNGAASEDEAGPAR